MYSWKVIALVMIIISIQFYIWHRSNSAVSLNFGSHADVRGIPFLPVHNEQWCNAVMHSRMHCVLTGNAEWAGDFLAGHRIDPTYRWALLAVVDFLKEMEQTGKSSARETTLSAFSSSITSHPLWYSFWKGSGLVAFYAASHLLFVM